MKLEGITLEFSGGLTIKLWPRWNRAAILTPFGAATTLSFRELQLSLAQALKDRKAQKRKSEK